MFRILSRSGDEQTRGRHERIPDTSSLDSDHDQQAATQAATPTHNHNYNSTTLTSTSASNSNNINISNIDPEHQIPTAEAISVDGDGDGDDTSSLLEGEATLVSNHANNNHNANANNNATTNANGSSGTRSRTQGADDDEASIITLSPDDDADHNLNIGMDMNMLMEANETDELLRLSAEREIHRRKSSTCFVLVGLFLFRLWVEALIQGDMTFIIFVSIVSSYFVGWMRHRRTVQRDFQERIEALREEQLQQERNESGTGANAGTGTGTGANAGSTGTDNTEEEDAELGRSGRSRARARARRQRDRDRESRRMRSSFDFSRSDHIDLEMLSFQAQLAFAIMESQRHILETGGYGRPDGDGNGDDQANAMRGVSDSAKSSWMTFAYDKNCHKVIECEDLKPHKNEDPSCCICLCEYEEGEMLYQLKCGHVYHKECIDSWCQNHTRCPLCNLDLEEGGNAGAENESASIV